MDNTFMKLQNNKVFFIMEVALAIYILIFLALISEKFLMPCLLNISKKYGLSWDITGIVIAIGNIIPELATTILSFLRHGVKMTEFGIACNLGSTCFSITIVPAIALLLTYDKSN